VTADNIYCMTINRRDFIRASAITGGALATGAWSASETTHDSPKPTEPIARATEPLRILILGGTGLTGPHQVRYAVGRGHKVTVFNRGRHNERLPDGVEELQGDRQLHQVQPLKGREWDVVIDNPTSLPFWIKDVGEVLAGHTKQFVMISTISVYNPAGQSTITESSPLMEYKGGDPLAVTQAEFAKDVGNLYGPMKVASEREARKWFGDKTTIIRPGLIVGPGDSSFRFTYWPYRIDQGGEILAPGDGTDPVQVIDARDLAEWTIRVVENRAFGTFNAAGPRAPLTMAEQLYGIRAALPGDKDIKFTWVPSSFLAEQHVSPWGEMPTWLPSSDPESVISRTNCSKAIAAGLTFRPLATTSVDALAWFKEQPEADRARMVKAAGIAPEKEKTVLAAWRARAKS
jgi:2'-hydroxyisoflavone reductase